MSGLRLGAALIAAIALSACGEGTQGVAPLSPVDRTARAVNRAAFPQAGPGQKAGAYDPALVKAQVLLDRARFSPGAIDGRDGANLHRALKAYAQANGMASDGTLTQALWKRLTMADPRPAIRAYVIDADDVAGPFTPDQPTDVTAQAKLDTMSWREPAEELAEAFHMEPDLLRALNPGADFRPGSTVLVADRGNDDLQVLVSRVEADKAAGLVKAYGDGDRLLATYPASIGGPHCPPPAGTLSVRAVAAQPTYAYDSAAVGIPSAVRGLKEVAAGPNNPIGVVWIDLSKDGYGLHGSAEPSKVGQPSQLGCVALTNWDARELARAVVAGVPVVFK